MAGAGFDQGRFVRDPILLVEEAAGFGLETNGGRRSEIHLLAADGAGHHLYLAGGIVAPGADIDSVKH